jgi:hypothetical protein
MKLEELLRVIPDDTELRAARARRSALSRLDSDPSPGRGWSWRPSLALAALCLLAIALITGRPAKAPMAPEPERERSKPLRVQMILGDGTRVEWTFREDFRL